MQQAFATPQAPQSSASTTYADAQVAGRTNIIAIGWNDTAAVLTAVTDTAGNTYQVAVPTFRGNRMSQAIRGRVQIVVQDLILIFPGM